jgi:bifunctional UDP-N-acetylglucosamine pyrophosphorylase/glucosamine-1-phosphate N-acetyltransferase
MVRIKELQLSYYFDDLRSCPCPKAFEGIKYPWDSLEKKDRIYRMKEIEVHGNIHKSVVIEGLVKIGKNTLVGANVVIEGPVIIGEHCVIRPNALIRSGTIIGNNVVVGHSSEVKNTIVFDEAKLASHVFAGDSILGKGARLGSGTILGNRRFDQGLIYVEVNGVKYSTDREKFGCVIGEYSRLGANCSTSPGSLIGKHTWIVGNTLVKGFIPSDKLVRAKQTFEMADKERLYLSKTDSEGKV